MNTNIIIRIPDPCHEDWNKMTPVDKGRFCSSCSKTVHDFTGKNDIEIRDILMENKDAKICGHFRKSQLDRPLNLKIDLNNIPRNMSITKVFMVATFLVFGSMLFSCYDNHGKKINNIEVSAVDTGNVSVAKENDIAIPGMMLVTMDSVPQCSELQGQVFKAVDTIEGGMDIEYIQEPPDVTSGGAPIVEIIKGDVSVTEREDSVITGKPAETISKNLNPELKDTLVNPIQKKIAEDTSHSKQVLISEINSTEKKNLLSGTEKANETSLFGVYPNPSSGEFVVNYELKKRSDVLLQILDDQGKVVKNLVNMSSQYEGKYKIPVNIKDLSNGIYLVSLMSEGKKTVKKIVLEK